MAMARPQEQPASFACPNYPFCAIADNAPAPQQYQPHQDLYLAQRQALNQPLVADVPGIAQWYADLHAVSSPISFKHKIEYINPGPCLLFFCLAFTFQNEDLYIMI